MSGILNILSRVEQALASGRAAVAANSTQPGARCALFLTGATPTGIAGNLLPLASVLITDSRHVSDYQRQGVNAEYLAGPDMFGPGYPRLEVLSYLVRRLAILRVKWQLDRVIVEGESAKEVATAWQQDPEGPEPGFFGTLSPKQKKALFSNGG